MNINPICLIDDSEITFTAVEPKQLNLAEILKRAGRITISLDLGEPQTFETWQECSRWIAEQAAARQGLTARYCSFHNGIIEMIPGRPQVKDTCCADCLKRYFGAN